MKKETQTKRAITLSDEWATYAKSISGKRPSGEYKGISEGLRVALQFHKDQSASNEQ